ncbi:MAG: DUF1284 domain-containing protein [Clostridiales bacterium]|nr:DUF1284 domain-containing protein [Clostridiales bacterium]
MSVESGPRLRGHHLICLQFMHGKGHSAEFARNVIGVLERLTESPGTVVAGPDDLCARCPALVDGICVGTVEGEGEAVVRVLDALALELLEMRPGDAFEYGATTLAAQRILKQWRSLACAGCPSEADCGPMIDLMRRFQPLD